MTTLDARPDEFLSSIYRVISSDSDNLTNENVVKMIFLFSDLCNEELTERLLDTNTPKCGRLFCLVKHVLEQKHLPSTMAVNVWAELLFFTKNYRFLRNLGTCKHKTKEQILRGAPLYSSEFRRYLVSLADDMTNEDVQYIWRKIHKSNRDCPDQPELLFLYMLRERLIREGNVEELQFHFNALERKDLSSKSEQYLEKAGALTEICEVYDLELDSTTGYCGLALIFNNKTFELKPSPGYAAFAVKSLAVRTGTDIDAERLKKLWKSFGMKVHVYPDTDTVTFKKLLNDCLAGDLSSVKILIVCILSHGSEGMFFCADRVPVETAYVENLLGTSEKLAGKPKLMFIQACQGHTWQIKGNSCAIAESFDLDGPDSPESMPVPQFSDMFIGTSTVPGFLSIRHLEEGTHFIQTLVDVLELSGDSQDLPSLVTAVNNKVAHKWAWYRYEKKNEPDIILQVVQMPSFRHQLTKWLKFKRAISILQN